MNINHPCGLRLEVWLSKQVVPVRGELLLHVQGQVELPSVVHSDLVHHAILQHRRSEKN